MYNGGGLAEEYDDGAHVGVTTTDDVNVSGPDALGTYALGAPIFEQSVKLAIEKFVPSKLSGTTALYACGGLGTGGGLGTCAATKNA